MNAIRLTSVTRSLVLAGLAVLSSGARAETRSAYLGQTLYRGQYLDVLRFVGGFGCGDHIYGANIQVVNQGWNPAFLSLLQNGYEWQRAMIPVDHPYRRSVWVGYRPSSVLCQGTQSLGIQNIGYEPIWVGNLTVHFLRAVPPPPPAPPGPPTPPTPPPARCERLEQGPFNVAARTQAARVLACPNGWRRVSQGHAATTMSCAFETGPSWARLVCTNPSDEARSVSKLWIQCCDR